MNDVKCVRCGKVKGEHDQRAASWMECLDGGQFTPPPEPQPVEGKAIVGDIGWSKCIHGVPITEKLHECFGCQANDLAIPESGLRNRLRDAQEKLNSLKTQLDEARAEIAKVNDFRERLTMERRELSITVDTLKDSQQRLTSERDQLKSERDAAVLSNKHLSETVALLNREPRPELVKTRELVATLRTHVATLKGALEPIAKAGEWFFSGINDNQVICDKLTVGHLRTAAAAIASVEGGR